MKISLGPEWEAFQQGKKGPDWPWVAGAVVLMLVFGLGVVWLRGWR